MIRRIRQKPQRKYFTSRELKKYIPVFDSGRIRPAEEYLQDIIFNQTTSLYEDTKGNMTPVVTGVPVANFTVANGDYITLTNEVRIESGDTLEFWMKPTAVATGIEQVIFSNYKTTPSRVSKIELNPTSNTIIGIYITFADESGWEYKRFIFSTPISAAIWTKFTLVLLNDTITLTRFDTGESKVLTFSKNIYFSIKKIGTYNENQFFGGNIFGIKKNGVLIASLQEFSGSKIFSPAGAVIGTWSGTGSRYTRLAAASPNPHQAADIKRVTHAGGTAYVPATVSDATINANFTTVTLIETLSGLYKDDGSRMNLHPTTSNLVTEIGATILDEHFDTSLNGFVKAGGDFNLSWQNSSLFGEKTVASGNMVISKFLVLIAGKRYRIKFKAKSPNVVTTKPYLGSVGVFYTQIATIGTHSNLNTSFQEYEFIAITKYPSVYIYLNQVNVNIGDIVILDDIFVEEITTLSDYLNTIESTSGIDLNSYEAGEDLPTAYKHTIVADKSTTKIKLLKP